LGASRKILCGGDVFDVPKVNLDVADDLVDVFVKHGCELVTVFGNHDLENALASAPSTVLGHMMRRASSVVKALPMLGARPLEINGVLFWGHHYKYQNHKDVLRVDIVDPDKPRVIISHSMLLKEKPVWEEELYVLFDDLTTNAQLVLVGHYHPQQPMYRLDNPYATQIGGPGALLRGALSRDDLSRDPAMAVLEWDPQAQDFLVDFVPVECAAPAAEIFRIEEAQAERARSDAMESFRAELDDMKVHGDSVSVIIERIAQQEQLPDDVKQESLRRIGAI
jgi:hypothetical protein